MTLPQALLLFLAALLGGALNSVAGGGSFLTVPALIFTGVAAKTANITSTVAIWPGTLASVGAYRKELGAQRRELMVLGSVSLVGGILGALLLLGTSQTTFVRLLPYLLLLATLVFIFGPRLSARIRARSAPMPEASKGIAALTVRPSARTLVAISAAQLAIAIYGGYFGGGIGILMLASLGLMGMENIHEMNALKTALTSAINGVAVVAFIAAGAVFWGQALLMAVGAIIGGYGAAAYARRLDPKLVRGFVIVVAVTMTAYFLIFRRNG
jgi:uncharacterized membrane protein YfcA